MHTIKKVPIFPEENQIKVLEIKKDIIEKFNYYTKIIREEKRNLNHDIQDIKKQMEASGEAAVLAQFKNENEKREKISKDSRELSIKLEDLEARLKSLSVVQPYNMVVNEFERIRDLAPAAHKEQSDYLNINKGYEQELEVYKHVIKELENDTYSNRRKAEDYNKMISMHIVDMLKTVFSLNENIDTHAAALYNMAALMGFQKYSNVNKELDFFTSLNAQIKEVYMTTNK